MNNQEFIRELAVIAAVETGHVKSYAEREFDAELAEREAANDAKGPKPYPAKKYATSAPIPGRMLHGALFQVASKNKERVERVERAIPLCSGGRIEYRGAELRQAEMLVFAYLCNLQAPLKRNKSEEAVAPAVGEELRFGEKEAIKVLGWSASKHSALRLDRCLNALADSRLVFKDKGGKTQWNTGLVWDWKRDGGDIVVRMSEALRAENWTELMGTTFLSVHMLSKLKEGVTTWLYAFVSANSCQFKLNTDDLRVWSGSGATSKEWGRELRKALKELEAAGVIGGFNAGYGTVSIFKNNQAFA